MSGPGLLPPLPTQFQLYNSYEIDPMWQRRFSAIWAAVVGVAILIALPRLIKSLRNGRAWSSNVGIWEDFSGKNYEAVVSRTQVKSEKKHKSPFGGYFSTLVSFTLWAPPYLGLTVGQMLIIFAYILVVLICITMHAPLIDNPNRAGFLALAQLPVVFLFGTKNSILSILLGPGNGWERLNYIHRWSGRGLFLAATVHGALWIRNHLVYDIPILGQQKETSGVAAFGLLCVIVITSFRVVRYWAYQFFFVIHILGFVAFFITICYHTPYASPWIFPPLAFYGFDILLRLFRYRIKDAALIPFGDQMTIIQVNDCDGGWVAGQHVRLRVFFGGRIFESHPLTILSAPPKTSCLSIRSLAFGSRANGDWSKALNAYARAQLPAVNAVIEKERKECDVPEGKSEWPALGVPINVMIDGPYGGCSIDLGDFESVLLVSGGSGATFCIGLLDDIVGRCVKLGRQGGERTQRVEFAWCIRSFGHIDWFAPLLQDIAYTAADSSIDLHITIYVTCLCAPEEVPIIPNSDVIIEHPSVRGMLGELITPPALDSAAMKLKWVGLGGGVGVCAAGPENLTREASNAVARLALTKGRELGGIELHTELYAL